MFKRLKSELINSVYQSISQLRYINIDRNRGFDLAALIGAYRGVFGEEYTKNTTEIIAEEVRRDIRRSDGSVTKDNDKSFYKFLRQHHCCWIDFIGCDDFSSKAKKQVFFSTVSMSKNDVYTRSKFLSEYNELLNNGVPVDIFVQLFFTDPETLSRQEVFKNNPRSVQIIQKLKTIQTQGLLVNFGNKRKSDGIVSAELPCKPVLKETKLQFDQLDLDNYSLCNEIVGFLDALEGGQKYSKLVQEVALLNRSLHKQVKWLYFFPLHNPDGAIGLFCYGSKKMLSWTERRDLLVFAYNIMSPFISACKSAWENQKITSEAIKSAISAIMSRNMSHNLGSHYLYYTKCYLEDLANASGEKGPDIRGAAKVLGYMQARMDYLATIISNDRYPNGAVNFKSQIYDELTIDDFSKRHFSSDKDKGKRTTNFLLSNLVMSENFTRSNILVKKNELDKEKVGEHFMPIRLQVKLWDGKGYELFTGVSDKEIIDGEKGIKNKLSKLNIALPGGTMSCHAFFNILENFIRNSAKYLQSDFKEEGLVFTIAIRRNYSDATKFDFIVYDNKTNAKKVLPVVTDQLVNLRILDDAGGVEKSSKGLKEMLFSSVWMRTYKYPLMTFADVINIIQNTENGYEKLKIIEEYGFKFVSVSDSGEIMNEQSPNGNLGLVITLPEFKIATNFVLNEHDTEKDIISNSLEISSDIVCFDEDVEKKAEKNSQLLSYFTRLYFEREFKEDDYFEFCEKTKVIAKDDQTARLVYRYKRILDKRFDVETGGDIDNMCLWVGDTRDCKRIPQDKSRIIYFERHLSTKKEGFEPYEDYAYVDSISGGNFTITINSLIEDGLSEFKYKTWYDKLYGLKIKESALTRITLIDERLFNSMKNDGMLKEKEYSFRNVRVMNINLEKADAHKWSIKDILEGNSFRNNSNKTHFLSIHLGLIEKVVKSEWGDAFGKGSSIEDRVTCFMQQLRDYFGGENHDVFISVHSGRGNFSKELEGPLASYPFISLAAIENAFSNSKFLLSQLFYNIVYIGKGIING